MKYLFALCCVLIFLPVANSADLVSETDALNGTNITYEYTSGRSYNVKFEKQGLSYRYLTGNKPERWWGPFPYKAFEVDSDIYLASWFEKGYGDHVTLMINFNNKLIYGSALIAGEEIHFHGANLLNAVRQQ